MSGHVCTLDWLLANVGDVTVADLETPTQRARRLARRVPR